MPGSKGQKAVHACMIRLLNLGPAKHEKVAIYVVNQRISNVCRIAGAASQRSNSQASDLFIEEINDQLLQGIFIDVKLIVELAELILSPRTVVVGIRKGYLLQ